MKKTHVTALILIGIFVYSYFGTRFDKPLLFKREAPVKRKVSANRYIQESKQSTVNRPKAAQTEVKELSSKLRNFIFMLKNNTAIQKANPGLNIAEIKEGDPRLQNLIIPAGLSFMSLNADGCDRNTASNLGTVDQKSMGLNFENLKIPKFVTIRTSENQTLEDLSSKLEKNQCSLALIPNKSMASAQLSNAEIKRLLSEKQIENVKLYEFKEVYNEAYTKVTSSIFDGNPRPAQIFLAGLSSSSYSVPEGTDTTQPISAFTLANGAGQVSILPYPSTSDEGAQIADANNAIIAAVASGADFVLVPPIDPSYYEEAAKIAAENDVKLYVMETDVVLAPSSLVDRKPASQ